MRILVTGAAGYLGTGIVRQLCENGHEVIASCRSKSSGIDKRAYIIEKDIFEMTDPYVTLEKPDVLLHLAWENGFDHESPTHIYNLSKHYDFIRYMVRGGVKHVAVMGTMHEIGFFEGPIKENTPANPKSLYGIAKNALRNITSIICEQNDITLQWLRGFYIVGNVQNGCSVFSKIANAELQGQEFFPFTSGLNQWDFLEYEEFCKMTARTVEQNAINGIINICNGRPEKLSERVERFIEENHFRIKLDYGKFPDRSYDSKAVWGDDKKIKKIMGMI